MANSKKTTFEESLKKLEEIVQKLESGDLPLDEAFEYYKKGMDLSLYCSKELKSVEKEVLKIQRNYEGKIEESSYGLIGGESYD